MEITQPLVVHAAMMIRRPPHGCYEAFVDPSITTKFWFTESSGRLDAGRPVTWTWSMYGMSTRVAVKELVPDRKILIEWDVGTDDASTVEWTFTEREDGSTFIDVRNFGLTGDAGKQVQRLVDSTEGFSLTLAAAKAWLEHGLNLWLIEDRHPDNRVEGWQSR